MCKKFVTPSLFVLLFSLKSISAVAEDPFSGPYIGLQAAQSHIAIDYDYRADYREFWGQDASGYEGGVYVGYGRTFNNFYLGLQGDYLIGTAAADEGARLRPASARRIGETTSYGVSGRFGYNLNNAALPYVLLGWQHLDIDVSQDYQTKVFDQIGSYGLEGMRLAAGVEFPLLPHVMARVEYGQTLYSDLVIPYPATGGVERDKVTGGTGRVGIAYNFGGPDKTTATPPSGVTDPFAGFYLGLEGGVEMGNFHRERNHRQSYADYAAEGFAGGVFAGYGATFGNIYAGVQAGFTMSTATNDEGASYGDDHRLAIGPYGDVTGRLGYVFADTVMPYVLAGWRRANFTYSDVDFGERRFSTTRDGWVVGLGTEVMVTKNISLRLEYDQANYQPIHISYPAITSGDRIDLVTNTGRIGVAYRF